MADASMTPNSISDLEAFPMGGGLRAINNTTRSWYLDMNQVYSKTDPYRATNDFIKR